MAETSQDASEEPREGAESLAALRSHPRVAWHRADLPERSFGRIVSLVPSLSEALVLLGLGDRLVAVTEYCVLPAGAFDGLPRVGGTKDTDVAGILAVRPDLVIANQEENTARVVRQLTAQGVDVWVTYPRTVREGAELLRDLATLGASAESEARVVAPVLAAVGDAEARRIRARAAGARPPRVFCAIWRDPWMSVAADTYIHDLIELCGGANVFAEPLSDARSGRAERRYPIVDLQAIERAAPDVMLLPSEPYAFADADRQALRRLDCPASVHARIHLIDGTLVSWYGPRISEAIRVLGQILAIS
jgi:ABC-type hemin transport system substrate-binding protein